MVVMLQKKLSLLLHLQHKSLHLSIFSIPFVLNYGLLPGVSLTLSLLSWFPGRYDLKVGQFSTDIQSAIRYTWRDHWCRWTTWGMYMYIACAKALHCRCRVTSRDSPKWRVFWQAIMYHQLISQSPAFLETFSIFRRPLAVRLFA